MGKVFCNQGVLGGARKDSPRALGGSILAYRTVREDLDCQGVELDRNAPGKEQTLQNMVWG